MRIGNIHLKQSFKGLRMKLLALCLVIFLFQMLFAILGTSVKIHDSINADLKDVPEMVHKMMGKGFMESLLKYGIIAIGYIHPFILVISIIYIFIAVSQVLVSEINEGSIGFTLSKPLSRLRLYFNLWVVIYTGILMLAFSAFLASSMGIWLFHSEKISVVPFASIAWNLFLLMAFIAGYIAIFAVAADTGKKLFTYGGATIFFFYLLSYATPLWQPLEYINPISPFAYYSPMALLMGQRIAVSTSVILVMVSLIMFVVGAFLFNKRDVASG